jgi:hypothetical protein
MASFVAESSGYASAKDPIQVQVKTLGAVARTPVDDFGLGIEVGFSKVMAMFAHIEIQTLKCEPGGVVPHLPCFDLWGEAYKSFKYLKVVFEPADDIEALVQRSVGASVIYTCIGIHACKHVHVIICIVKRAAYMNHWYR